MNAIELMKHEHTFILRMLDVLRAMARKAMNERVVDKEDFYSAIDFVRSYADKHHHNKEEVVLFEKMAEELYEQVGQGPILGMLTEHDQGRLYMMRLETAVKAYDGDDENLLNLIASAISYTELLKAHIHKEDNALYTYAERALSKEALASLEESCRAIEADAEKQGVQAKYESMVAAMEDKYLS